MHEPRAPSLACDTSLLTIPSKECQAGTVESNSGPSDWKHSLKRIAAN